MQATYRDLTSYKYQLLEDYEVETPIRGHFVDIVELKFIGLEKNGVLSIKAGYAWDGASSCPDFNSIMRGSLVHDAFYQLLRMQKLPVGRRDDADRLIQTMCIEDGMNSLAAWLVYKALKLFGAKAAKAGTEKPVKRLKAPRNV